MVRLAVSFFHRHAHEKAQRRTHTNVRPCVSVVIAVGIYAHTHTLHAHTEPQNNCSGKAISTHLRARVHTLIRRTTGAPIPQSHTHGFHCAHNNAYTHWGRNSQTATTHVHTLIKRRNIDTRLRYFLQSHTHCTSLGGIFSSVFLNASTLELQRW